MSHSLLGRKPSGCLGIWSSWPKQRDLRPHGDCPGPGLHGQVWLETQKDHRLCFLGCGGIWPGGILRICLWKHQQNYEQVGRFRKVHLHWVRVLCGCCSNGRCLTGCGSIGCDSTGCGSNGCGSTGCGTTGCGTTGCCTTGFVERGYG